MTGLSHASKLTSSTLRDGTLISVNDHVYMASEFTGDSYYIGRIMEFGKQVKGKPLQVRIGWFYRPKDVMARRNHDPRLLVATMHSDLNPLASIRGRCVVTHQAYIKDLDAYKKKPDHFYYNQLFDRYIHRFYDVLPVESVRNLPPDVAEELNKRYQYIVVEAGTASEYTDAHRVCLICKRWCASGEALKCIMCHGFHHMLCINPPMLKKPSKGFAFQCALCTKLAMDSSASPTTNSSSLLKSTTNNSASSSGQNTPRGSPKQKSQPILTVAPSSGSKGSRQVSTVSAPPGPHEQKMSHMWPFRYFGTHADIRDIFDPDDRVYPRASSRVGARYQAAVVKWEGPGQILVTSTIFDDPSNNGIKGRSKKNKGGRPSNKLRVPDTDLSEAASRAQSASLESGIDGSETPLAPPSPARSTNGQEESAYFERGSDDTVSLMYSKPSHISEEYVSDYMEKVRALTLPIAAHSADLIDRALLELQKNGFDAVKALDEISGVQKRDFDIRDWTQKEIDAFEEGIRIYGHELFAIKKKVETRSMKDVVRFFYQWKKTERYQPVYSVFTKVHKPNKKFKSVGRRTLTSPVVDTAHRQETAVDHDSLILPTADNASTLECAHCGTTSTSMWRRTPGETDLLKKNPKVFCNDCGNDWVRYVALPSLVDPSKDSKKSKSKEAKAQVNGNNKAQASPSLSSTPTPVETPSAVKRKRGEPKLAPPVVAKKIKEQSREPTRSPSPVPEAPCAVCNQTPAPSEQLLSCHDCHLTVHRDCYGVSSTAPQYRWKCDTCQNNQNPTCSTNYDCVLCTKTSEHAPQALKRTTGNNWAHILCSVWIPEPTFVNVDTLSPVESIGKIRNERWKQVCSLCKQKKGACVGCGEGCKKAFHVTCARDAGYEIAFEMQPAKSVKGGVMVPLVWCPNHDLSSRKIIHIRDQPDALTDHNALQTYVHYYKQTDVSVPGAMRKCRLLMTLNPSIGASTLFPVHVGAFTPGRRPSHGGQGSKGSTKISSYSNLQECSQCSATVSPIWWTNSTTPEPPSINANINDNTNPGLANGHAQDITLHGEHDARIKTEEEDDKSGPPSTNQNDNDSLMEQTQGASSICHTCYWDLKASQ
ncbi:putative PHD type zinc finger protein with BAH domain-containing protein [Podila minutissima]|nr:putative PHD type zinc finger protein with BAH domain-containing protein [Podila minutissima]